MEEKEILNQDLPQEELVIDVQNVTMDFYTRDEKIDNLKEFVIRLIKGKADKRPCACLTIFRSRLKRVSQ